MFSIRRFNEVIKQLPLKAESENFVIRYGLRNPKQGCGLGPMGVRWQWLVPSYLDALERAYRCMTVDFNRSKPKTGPAEKTMVFVSELSEFTGGSPFTFDDPLHGPIIALPSRTEEPTSDGFAQRAMSEAVHETAHIFNFTSRPSLMRFDPDPWTWFDEATAVTLERTVLPWNADSLRYGMHWTDQPETSLDAEGFWYETFPFLGQICRCYETDFAGRIWEDAKKDPNWPLVRPLEVLSRLVGGTGQPYSGSDPVFERVLRDFFASAYFSWDQRSWGFAPDLFARHGERNLSESFLLRQTGKWAEAKHRLNHLAVRYYRVNARAEHNLLDISVMMPYGSDVPNLYSAVTTVSGQDWRPGPLHPLTPKNTSIPVELTGQICAPEKVEVDHFIVMVANCGVRPNTGDPNKPHDDDQQFTIRVRLL